jgi:Domain of unknown function (DUF3883)
VVDDAAMAPAEAYFRSLGFDVEDVHAPRSYDLHCMRGDQTLRVEVKGTTTAGDGVLLTPREVAFARAHRDQMGLYILHSVRLNGTPEAPVAHGGIEDTRDIPWDVASGELAPTGYLRAPA